MSKSSGRNEPCPCGSGKKYKKCCLRREAGLPNEFAELLRRPSPIDPSERVAAQITCPADLGQYLDAVVGTFRIFKLPRVEALLHCLRALHGVETAGLVTVEHSGSALYGRMRRAQDLLRYLVYEIFRRCDDSGVIRPSSFDEIKLADATVDEFDKLSRLRDGVESVNRGLADCRVDPTRRVVTITNPPETLRHTLLEQERIDRVLASAGSKSPDATPPPELLGRLFATVQIDTDARSFGYQLSEDLLAASIPWVDGLWRSGLSAPLPEDWSFGPYTVGEFRQFYLLLAAWTSLHALVFAKIASAGQIPETSAVPTPSVEEILEFMRRHGALDSAVSSEIVRDLTYDPVEVPWTDVQYQPLLPLVNGRVALPPIVISNSNFERNLLAVVEKLPWRHAAASRLKNSREQVMIDTILGETARVQISGRARLELKDGSGTVGDVDLLLWDRTGQVALAVQLKWLYGPDSLHETWAHGHSYRRGVEKHLGTVDFLRGNLPRVVRDYRLEGLTSTAEILPVLVTKDDEPMRLSVPTSLPAIPLREFQRVIRTCDGDVRGIHRAADEYWNREPALQCVEHRDRIAFGEYVFDLPVAVCAAPMPS